MAPLQQMSQVAHLVVLFVQFVQNFSTLAIYWAVMCLKTTAVRGAQNSEGKVCLGPQFSKCFSWPSRTIEKSETKLLEFDLTLVCSCKAGRIWNLNESRDYRFTTRLQYKAHHLAPASHIGFCSDVAMHWSALVILLKVLLFLPFFESIGQKKGWPGSST